MQEKIKRKKRTIQTADIYTIITIAIIAVPHNFNTFYNTLKITIFNTLKTEIFDSVTLITYKSRDILFARNKAISLLNT